MSPTGPPMPETIGKYRIVERIGGGGMGLVFKAHDPVLDRLVALKVISSDVDVTDEVRARFFREAKACAKLNHPNVVTVYDMGEDAGRLFIVMELLEGQELRRLIQAPAPQTLEDKLSVMLQVCQGLSYAHQNGIVHRDVKPGNIFLLRTGGVKILDFGIAHFATTEAALTGTGFVMGTLRYIAPEQLRGRADQRTDMFSVGAVFYELLTARPPFQADNPLQLIEQIRTEDPPLATDLDATVPPELAAIVQRAMRKDPVERFRDLDEMRAEIHTVHDRVAARLRRQRDRIVELRAALAAHVDDPEEPAPSPTAERGGLAAAQAADRELSGLVEALQAKLGRVHALAPAVQRAGALMERGRFEAAAVEFESVVAAMPEHRAAREGLARARSEAEAQRREALGLASQQAPEAQEAREAMARTLAATARDRSIETTVIAGRENATGPVPSSRGAPEIARKAADPSWRIRWPMIVGAALALAGIVGLVYWRPSAITSSRDQVVTVPPPPPPSAHTGAPSIPAPSTGKKAEDEATADTAATDKATVAPPGVRKSATEKSVPKDAGAERAAEQRAAATAAADKAAADQAATEKAAAERLAAEKTAADTAAMAERAAAEKAAAEKAATAKAAADKAAADQAAAEKAAAAKAAAEKAAAERAAAEKAAAAKAAADRAAAVKAAAKAAAEKAAADQAAADRAARGGAEVAVAVPPSQSLGRFGSDGRAIQQVLDELRRAYEAKDVALVQRIRPKLRADDLHTLRNTFDNAATYSLNLKVETIELRGNEAEARVFRQDVRVAKDGQIYRSEARVTIRFQRTQDRWTIDDIR